MLGLTRRQKDNLRALLTLPAALHEALADQRPHFCATHALTLRAALRAGQPLDLPAWVEQVSAKRLSVSQLRRRLKAAARVEAEAEPPLRLFADVDAVERGVIRLLPRRIEVAMLRAMDREQLRADCARMAAVLEVGGASPVGDGAGESR